MLQRKERSGENEKGNDNSGAEKETCQFGTKRVDADYLQFVELITELKLCFAEYGTEFTNMYGDIDERFYNAVCDAFHDVIEVVARDRELFDKWNSRPSSIVHDSNGIGWGFHDYLVEEYYGIPWVEDGDAVSGMEKDYS